MHFSKLGEIQALCHEIFSVWNKNRVQHTEERLDSLHTSGKLNFLRQSNDPSHPPLSDLHTGLVFCCNLWYFFVFFHVGAVLHFLRTALLGVFLISEGFHTTPVSLKCLLCKIKTIRNQLHVWKAEMVQSRDLSSLLEHGFKMPEGRVRWDF